MTAACRKSPNWHKANGKVGSVSAHFELSATSLSDLCSCGGRGRGLGAGIEHTSSALNDAVT
jgi:hypothetical protein